MKRRVNFLLVAMASVLMCQAQKPIVQTCYTSDPAPMVYKDTFYVYTGHDEDGQHKEFVMNEWRVYKSADMVNWTDCGAPLSLETFKWAEWGAWASQCIERNGHFYWYVCCTSRQTHEMAIGVAVADSPPGPFVDPLRHPLVAGSGGYIGPPASVGSHGDAYLYWGNPGLWCCKLNKDMISYDTSFEIKGKHVTKVKDGVWKFVQDEESFGGPEVLEPNTKPVDYKDLYEEGPFFYERDGKYYLMYAAGGVPEHIAYSMSKKPTGPWKYMGQVMRLQDANGNIIRSQDTWCWTNHAGVAKFKGNDYFVFHCGRLPGGSGFNRAVAIQKFSYNADGTIPEIILSQEPLESVGALNPFKRVEAETMAWSEGLKTESNKHVGVYVTDIQNGDYLQLRNVDFSRAAKTMEARVASSQHGGQIEVHLDSTDGKTIAKVEVPITGGWEDWTTVSGPVTETIIGKHDIYLVFKGRMCTKLFNFDYWQFK